MSCLDLSRAVGSLTNFSLGAHATPAMEEPGAQQTCQSTKETNKFSRYNPKEHRAEKEASARTGTFSSSSAKPTNFSLLHVWGGRTVQDHVTEEQVSA